jgi:hypothetical protein
MDDPFLPPTTPSIQARVADGRDTLRTKSFGLVEDETFRGGPK